MAVDNKIQTGALNLLGGRRGSSSAPDCNESCGHLTEEQFRKALLEHVANVFLMFLTKGGNHGPSLKEILAALEREVLDKAILLFGGHQAKTANFLHVLPTTLSAKLKKYKIVKKYKDTAPVKELSRAEGGRDKGLLKECGEPRPDSDVDDTRELPLDLKI